MAKKNDKMDSKMVICYIYFKPIIIQTYPAWILIHGMFSDLSVVRIVRGLRHNLQHIRWISIKTNPDNARCWSTMALSGGGGQVYYSLLFIRGDSQLMPIYASDQSGR